MRPAYAKIFDGRKVVNQGTEKTLAVSQTIEQRSDFLLHESQQAIYRRTDRMFAGLMLFQWVAAVVAAVVISPRAWAGTSSHIHLHVWAALLMGGALTLFPVSLAYFPPG